MVERHTTASEGRVFQRYFENASVGMTESATDGRFVRVNRRFRLITGYSDEELLALRFQEITHADDLGPELTLLEQTLQGKQRGYTIEKRLRTRAGEYTWVQRRVTLERGAEGAPDFLLSAVIDINERKMTERALQRSRAQLAAAQRIARLGSWEEDLTTGAMTWSDELFAILELDPASCRPSWQALLAQAHPDDRDAVCASHLESVQQRTPWHLDHRLLLPDGRVKYVQEYGETLYGDDGKPLRSVGTIHDVTHQRSTEDGLRDRERRLATILTSIREGVVLLELAGEAVRVAECNPAGLERLQLMVPGLSAPSLAGLDVGHLSRRALGPLPPVLADLASALQAISPTGLPRQFDLDWGLGTGERLRVELVLSPVPNDAGRPPTHFVAVLRDVTERWRAEQLLRASLAEKEVLLSEVHHRVKNNLQIVSSLLSLQGSQSRDEGLRAALDDSGRRIQAMAMVHELLCRSGRLTSNDLGRHLSALGRMVFDTTRRPGLEFTCEVEPVPLTLELALPLGLALNELVSNACKHAFEGRDRGHVWVRLRCVPEGLELVVGDDGVGLPEGFALERSKSLGLRIVSTLAQQLRGSLELERHGGTEITLRVNQPASTGPRACP